MLYNYYLLLMSELLVNDNYFIICPWCGISLQVTENNVKCSIFRCGVVKKTGKQINAHASEKDCKNYVKKKLIYGCGKPIKFDGTQVEKTDYERKS